VAKEDFIGYYIKGDQVQAAVGLNRYNYMLAIKEAISEGIMPSASEVKSGKVTGADILKRVQESKVSGCGLLDCCR